jgi:prolyl oligopeptidase
MINKRRSQLSGKTQIHKLYYHKLGTSQAMTNLIFGGEATPRRYIGAYVTEDQIIL